MHIRCIKRIYPRKFCSIVGIILIAGCSTVIQATGQMHWQNVDSMFGELPNAFHVYKCTDSLDGKPFIGFYAEAKLKSRNLEFATDTSFGRRLTPYRFFERNNKPLLVVNGSFFSFSTNQNLNLVINRGRLLSYNIHNIPGRGKDTFTYRHPFSGAIGITKNRRAQIGWTFTDSSKPFSYFSERAFNLSRDSISRIDVTQLLKKFEQMKGDSIRTFPFSKWKVYTAIGGGPVLVQNGREEIYNNVELKFTGKAIDDKHPRTAMGITADGRLIIMVVQGRFPGIAEGASLKQLARLMIETGCVEALNLDGGASSCMLINGRETIKPSDKERQRPVPAVFLIQKKGL